MSMEIMQMEILKENGKENMEVAEKNNSLMNLSGELYMKHPLEFTWVLWYFKQEKGRDWLESQKQVASIDTAEDFWALYNYIQPASCITLGCDYSFFKKGIQPMWEDESNHQGGRWVINLDKRMRQVELDQYWLEMLLAMIGEGFGEYSDEICGAVVNIRGKGDKLALWTKHCNDGEATLNIGRALKQRLNFSRDGFLEYQSHHATSNKGGSMNKAMYCL